MEYIVAAFIIGLAGSLHCLGMCGPIALMLHSRIPGSPYIHSALYNIGRLFTYMILGVIVASIGRGLALAGLQQTLTIATGVILLLVVVLPLLGANSFGASKWANTMADFVRKSMQRLVPNQSPVSFLGAGMVNGLLPCGLVYVALAGALNTNGLQQGGVFMLVFGLGTFPAMFFAGVAGKYLTLQRRLGIRKILPWFTAVVAILLIVRGLDLGIPYMSPHIDVQGQVMDCCSESGMH